MERVALRRMGAVLALLLVVGGGALAWWWWGTGPGGGGGGGGGGARVLVPDGVRIRVEVLNATRSRGLARRATMALREAGFDVVRYASDSTQRDTTLVLDRGGHDEWARLVVRALGTGRVLARPDSSRYLDITVLLGGDWRPPSQPFHP